MGLFVHSLQALEEEWKESIYKLYSVFLSPAAPLQRGLSSPLFSQLHEQTADICRVYFFCPSHWNTSPEEAENYEYPSFKGGTYNLWKGDHYLEIAGATELGTQELLRKLNMELRKVNKPAQHIVSPSLLFFHPPSEKKEIFGDVYLAPLGTNPERSASMLLRPMSLEAALDFNTNRYLQWVEEKHYLEEPMDQQLRVSRWQLAVSIVSILIAVLAWL